MRARSRLYTLATIILLFASAAAGMLLLEGALRLRAYVRFGTFGAPGGTLKTDDAAGIWTPVAGSNTGGIRINSLGFRGPEISRKKPDGAIRLAFIGASTTYCAEVRSNDRTWPHLVWQSLQDKYPHRTFDYVNAGVQGLSISGSLKNLQNRVRPLDPDVIVLYEGFNDLIIDSRQAATTQGVSVPADSDALSRWSLTWDLLRKNTIIWLAQRRARDAQRIRLDWAPLASRFKQRLGTLIDLSRRNAHVVAVATMSHRLRREMSAGEKIQAAESSLFYTPYLTPDGLIDAFDAYNSAIRDAAREHDVILIGDESAIPATAGYFADTIHFSDAGSAAMAHRVAAKLLSSDQFVRYAAGP